LAWFDSFREKPTPISKFDQLLEYGCSNGLYPAGLLDSGLTADHLFDGGRFLASGDGRGQPVMARTGRSLARSSFNVRIVFTHPPVLPANSFLGDHTPIRRFAVPFDDLVICHSLLERPTLSMERAQLSAIGRQIVRARAPAYAKPSARQAVLERGV